MKNDTINTLLRRKKGYALEGFLFAFLFLGGFLALGITVYRQHLKQIGDTYYGAWDAVVYGADAALYKDLQDHAAVKETGRMELLGYVLDAEEEVCGSLGYGDEAFIRIGGVELETGRLPERENEIALEGSMLQKLGYEKQLGQEIELKIVESIPQRKTGNNSEEFRWTVRRYVLTGIVNNYSAYWQEDGEWPVSCFLWKDPNCSQPAVRIHLYLSLKPQYASYRNAVETVCHNRGRWQINGHQKKGNFQPIDAYVYSRTIYDLLLYGLLLLAGITYLLYVLCSELRKNRELYWCLRFLGMGKQEFFHLCFRTKWRRVMVCCFAGCITGMVTSVLFEAVIQPFGEIGLTDLYDVKSVLVNLVMILGGTVVLLAIFSCFDYCITRFDGIMEKKSCERYRRKGKFSLSRCLQFLLGRKRSLTGWLLCGMTVMIIICSNTSWMFFRDYRLNLENYPYDYIFGGHTNYYRDPCSISPRELSEICNIKGITEIQYYGVDEYETVLYHNRNLLLYENYFDENGYPLTDSIVPGSAKKLIMGMSDGIIDRYQMDLDLDTDLYHAGGIILYVPDLYQLPSGQMGSELWMKSNGIDPDTSIKKFRDTSIKPGDTIRVDLGEKEVNLQVAGILRGVKDNVPRFLIPMAPYSIICSYEVYEALFGEKVVYSCVMLNTDDSSFRTDLELSRTSSGYLFQNYRSQRNQIITKCIIYLALSVFLTEAVVFLSLLQDRKGRNGALKQVWNRMYQFHMLGMSLGEMKKEINRKYRGDSLACILLADGIFMGVQVLLNLYKYRKSFDNSEILSENLWDYVLSKTACNINFSLLFAVSILLYLLFRMLQHRNMRRMLKEIAEKCG